jgi:tRNA (guanine-N7-)-methyltransferase
MRKKKLFLATLDQLVDHTNIFHDPEIIKKTAGKWNKQFGNKLPIVLEIGMGTGGFLKQLITYEQTEGIKNNYIGFEIKGVRVFKSYRKNKDLIDQGILKLIEGRADSIDDYFGKSEVATIYLNFSDPWPKDKHILNRLTAPKFLDIYEKILKPDGSLFIKTDNQQLFRYSLETLPAAGFKIVEQDDDLHASNFLIKNFITEFESRFIAEGMPIYYLKAVKDI